MIDRARAKRELETAHRRITGILSSITDCFFSLDRELRFTYANPQAVAYLGSPLKQILGRPLGDVLPKGKGHSVFSSLREALKTHQTLHVEFLSPTTGKWVDLAAYPSEDGLNVFFRDVSSRKLTEESLRKAHDELAEANAVLQAKEIERRKLIQRLVMAQEEERQRISLELHDQTSQHFAALRAMLTTLKDPLRSQPENLMTLERIEDIAERLAALTHTMATQLRAPALKEEGLVHSISRYVEDWSAHHSIGVDFHCVGKSGVVPKLTEVALYRIIQEALTNVLKHAKAHNVTILIEFFPRRIRAVIEDDGIGFNPAAVPIGPLRLGIQGMRERVCLVDGQFDLESTPGSGTAIYVTLPLTAGIQAKEAHQ